MLAPWTPLLPPSPPVPGPKTPMDPFRFDPQFEDVDAETCAVMQNRVNTGVRAKYESEKRHVRVGECKIHTLVIQQPRALSTARS